MWASAGPGPSWSSPKQWKLDGCVKIYNSASARSPLTKSKKKTNYRERSNIKCARVSALTGSLPRKNGWDTHGFQHSSGIEPMLPDSLRLTLTTKPFGSYHLLKKNGTWLVVFRHLQAIFLRTGLSYLDCSSWISRPDTKNQNSWTQTFDQYILLHST